MLQKLCEVLSQPSNGNSPYPESLTVEIQAERVLACCEQNGENGMNPPYYQDESGFWYDRWEPEENENSAV